MTVRLFTVLLIFSTLLALGSCHPLINPADPGSITYTGEPVANDAEDPNPDPDSGTDDGTTDEEIQPVLPTVARWELTTFHTPGFGTAVAHPLEITSDGAFVEPRRSSSFELWMTMSSEFSHEDAEGAHLWAVFTDGVTTRLELVALGSGVAVPELRRLGIWLGDLPSGTRFKLRLVDRTGVLLGERDLAYLIGDVNGDGVVEHSLADGTDQRLVTDLDGFVPSRSNLEAVRADIDLDGVVDSEFDWVTGVPEIIVGAALPATFPAFSD